mmetsp:Transcript_103202/g.205083  ORF Transcript_103202/g.205083 Transcript_103202/m.205083 type:complete len:86 (+) Transcript_103202:137-394(+)
MRPRPAKREQDGTGRFLGLSIGILSPDPSAYLELVGFVCYSVCKQPFFCALSAMPPCKRQGQTSRHHVQLVSETKIQWSTPKINA